MKAFRTHIAMHKDRLISLPDTILSSSYFPQPPTSDSRRVYVLYAEQQSPPGYLVSLPCPSCSVAAEPWHKSSAPELPRPQGSNSFRTPMTPGARVCSPSIVLPRIVTTSISTAKPNRAAGKRLLPWNLSCSKTSVWKRPMTFTISVLAILT